MDIAPADAKLVPISADHFASVAEFLHKEMNSKVSIDQWQRVIAANWSSDAPNHGFMLHHEAVGVVGVLCAIYAHVVIDGEIRNVCNPHTWCVLDAFRKRSIELVVAVIKQPDWHFSMLSPNAEGEQIFSFLKFFLG